MRRLTALVAALVLPLSAPIGASDFSGMADAAYARSMLLSSARNAEISCAALAYLPYQTFEVIDVMDDIPPDPDVADDVPLVDAASDAALEPEIKFEKYLDQADAEALKSAVLSRVSSDVGDNAMAEEVLQFRISALSPGWDRSAENIAQRARTRDTLKPGCAVIFDAAKANALDTVLTAASPQPITLPDVNTCLAYDLIGRASKHYADYDYLHDEGDGKSPYDQLLGKKGKKRVAREAEVAALAANLDVSPDVAALRMMPCLSVFAAALRK